MSSEPTEEAEDLVSTDGLEQKVCVRIIPGVAEHGSDAKHAFVLAWNEELKWLRADLVPQPDGISLFLQDVFHSSRPERVQLFDIDDAVLQHLIISDSFMGGDIEILESGDSPMHRLIEQYLHNMASKLPGVYCIQMALQEPEFLLSILKRGSEDGSLLESVLKLKDDIHPSFVSEQVNDTEMKQIKCINIMTDFRWQPVVSLEKCTLEKVRLCSDQGGQFRCPFCKRFSLPTESELRFHLSCHREGKADLLCPVCGETRSRWSKMLIHLSTHGQLGSEFLGQRHFECDVCGRVLTSKASLKRHREEVHERREGFFCEHCGERFIYRKTFLMHMDRHRGELFRCSHCNYTTTVRRLLQLHERKHNGRMKQCPFCEKQFLYQNLLDAHVKYEHLNEPGLICDVCGAIFKGQSKLQQHLNTAHTSIDSTFKCDKCGLVASSAAALRAHAKRAHQKQLRCEECPYSSDSEQAFRRHMEMVHNPQRAFACSQCSFHALTIAELKNHMDRRHDDARRKFECNICGFRFDNQFSLDHHMPKHTGELPYECRLCGFRGKFRQSLVRHVRVKHPEELEAAGSFSHFRLHHNQRPRRRRTDLGATKASQRRPPFDLLLEFLKEPGSSSQLNCLLEEAEVVVGEGDEGQTPLLDDKCAATVLVDDTGEQYLILANGTSDPVVVETLSSQEQEVGDEMILCQ